MVTIIAYMVGFLGSANSSMLWEILRDPRHLPWQPNLGKFSREQRELPWKQNLGKNQPKLHLFQLCARNREICHVNSRVFTFRVRELKYAIRIFKGTKGVAVTTKFRQKYAKIEHITL